MRASCSMALVAALALRARRAETKKIGGVRPRAERMPPSTKERTSSTFDLSARRSALLMTSRIFFPQSRMSSRYPRSLSVSGRSAEVTNSTRSLLGTKPRESSSWWRMIAFVPGVSTMEISRKNSLGRPCSNTPSFRARSTGSSAWRSTVMRSVVGGYAPCGNIGPEQGVHERGLARVELANDHEQEHLLEIGERPPDEFRVLLWRAEILQEGNQTLQQPALPLYQRLAPLVEYPYPLGLPLHASIRDAGWSRDARFPSSGE